MYTALDVAMHVVNYINDQGGTVSNLKLQKLLYFVQGFFLILRDRPCFADDVEAWDFGPAIPEVYFEFREYGSSSIPSIDSVTRLSVFDDFWEDMEIEDVPYEDKIVETDARLIHKIVDAFRKYSASSLVTITHKHTPWINAHNIGGKHNIISKESITKYFKQEYVDSE